MAYDAVANFVKVTVSTGYNAAATSIVLVAGAGATLPTVPFNMTWWDSTLYQDPADDSNREIVRVTARVVDTLTVTRAQEGTAASTKNTAGSTYKMSLGPTAKTITDLEAAIASGSSGEPIGQAAYNIAVAGTNYALEALNIAINGTNAANAAWAYAGEAWTIATTGTNTGNAALSATVALMVYSGTNTGGGGVSDFIANMVFS